MDSIHDLGGKQGYGAIDIDDPGDPFHHPWEAREWGISRCARTPNITIDWWRHCRELIAPEDYLTRPYFDSWAQTDFATYIDAGLMSVEEIVAACNEVQDNSAASPRAKMTQPEILALDRKKTMHFDGDIESAASFSVGQAVITVKHGYSGHTRLPQYARNCRGRIHAHHGAHVFPDQSARGIVEYQHLYSVVFEAAELWSDSDTGTDKIYLDLWEDYLKKDTSL
ncbi:MAG: nitrile hydratase beta subunit [Planctomycetota bacterium]|jgi:nitrile hydratase beta subunit